MVIKRCHDGVRGKYGVYYNTVLPREMSEVSGDLSKKTPSDGIYVGNISICVGGRHKRLVICKDDKRTAIDPYVESTLRPHTLLGACDRAGCTFDKRG
jgi:hypothetical protein